MRRCSWCCNKSSIVQLRFCGRGYTGRRGLFESLACGKTDNYCEGSIMNAWVKMAVGLVATVWLAGCSGIPVDTDYDPDYKLSLTSSYAWMEAPKAGARDPVVENDLLARRVQRSVDAELAAQGLRLVAADQEPELLVTFHAGEVEKMDIDTTDHFYGHYGYYPCWGCWGGGPYGYGNDVWVRYYTEGTLMVDIVDAKTK